MSVRELLGELWYQRTFFIISSIGLLMVGVVIYIVNKYVPESDRLDANVLSAIIFGPQIIMWWIVFWKPKELQERSKKI